MKIELQFGSHLPKFMDWPKTVKEFPALVLYKGIKYEFAIYNEDDTGRSDYVFIFSTVQSYDPNWYATVYEDIDQLIASTKECDCGAKVGEGHFLFCQTRNRKQAP